MWSLCYLLTVMCHLCGCWQQGLWSSWWWFNFWGLRTAAFDRTCCRWHRGLTCCDGSLSLSLTAVTLLCSRSVLASFDKLVLGHSWRCHVSCISAFVICHRAYGCEWCKSADSARERCALHWLGVVAMSVSSCLDVVFEHRHRLRCGLLSPPTCSQ